VRDINSGSHQSDNEYDKSQEVNFKFNAEQLSLDYSLILSPYYDTSSVFSNPFSYLLLKKHQYDMQKC